MQDHQNPILDSMRAHLERPEEEEHDPCEDVLSVEAYEVYQIVLGVGGPTRYFTVKVSDGEVVGAEYYDSWGYPRTSVELNSSELAELMDLYGDLLPGVVV